MLAQIRAFASRLPWGWLFLIAAISMVVSVGAFVLAAVALPANYFATDERPRPKNRVLAALLMIALNIVGLVLVLIGIVLSLPGVPGQGVLTILLGLLLMDFPGKRAFEKRLLQRPRLLGWLNAIRARFSRPPLQRPE